MVSYQFQGSRGLGWLYFMYGKACLFSECIKYVVTLLGMPFGMQFEHTHSHIPNLLLFSML